MSLSDWCQFVLFLVVLALGHWLGGQGYRVTGMALEAGAVVAAFQVGRQSRKGAGSKEGTELRR